MSCQKLPNYLRTHRRRTGLSQREVAFLLGSRTAETVCRYERFQRTPSLFMALACEILFQIPIREILGGEYQKVEEAVRRRARCLTAELITPNPDQLTARKLSLLRTIGGGNQPQ